MGMSAADMVAAIRAHQSGITPSPNEGPNGDVGYADAMLLALCQGIIDEIIAGAVTDTAVSSGSSAGSWPGNVTG